MLFRIDYLQYIAYLYLFGLSITGISCVLSSCYLGRLCRQFDFVFGRFEFWWQAACIPLALSGRDICGSAITGSGKVSSLLLSLDVFKFVTSCFSVPDIVHILLMCFHADSCICTTYAREVVVPSKTHACNKGPHSYSNQRIGRPVSVTIVRIFSLGLYLFCKNIPNIPF